MSRRRRSQYESNAGRGLEIVVGVILLSPALVLLYGGVLLAWEMPADAAVVLIDFALLGLGWSLLVISYRLISGRGRTDGGLLPPSAIMFGALAMLVGVVIAIILGIVQRDVIMIAAALMGASAPYYAWRLAKRRRKAD